MRSIKQRFDKLTIQQILQKYEFPHRFLVYFASQCAKDAQQYNKKPDPRALKAIEIAERFGNGEEFTPEFLKEIAHAANAAYAATHAAAAADAADAAADAANAAAYAAYAAANAANAAYAANAANAAAQDKYKQLLIDLIDSRLTQLERVLILEAI